MSVTIEALTASAIRHDGIAARWPRAASITYVGAWVVGLTAFGVGPASDATDAELARWFADHRVTSTLQSLLIHGVAAIALYGVLAAVRRTGCTTRTSHAAGVTAVRLSLLQCALDVWRGVFSHGSVTSTLVHTIDRIDGLKMFALAVMIGTAVHAYRSAGLIGRRMERLGGLAAVALVVSGIAYAGAMDALVVSAELSLVLLLVWVGNAGFAAAAHARRTQRA